METEQPSPERKMFVESFNTKEGVLAYFNETKDFIEESCGIKLTNIELVGLRKITEGTMEEAYRQETEKDLNPNKPESLSDIDPRKEIPARFFKEFYDLDPADLDRLVEENSDEIFKEYFKRKQASLHLI